MQACLLAKVSQAPTHRQGEIKSQHIRARSRKPAALQSRESDRHTCKQAPQRPARATSKDLQEVGGKEPSPRARTHLLCRGEGGEQGLEMAGGKGSSLGQTGDAGRCGCSGKGCLPGRMVGDACRNHENQRVRQASRESRLALVITSLPATTRVRLCRNKVFRGRGASVDECPAWSRLMWGSKAWPRVLPLNLPGPWHLQGPTSCVILQSTSHPQCPPRNGANSLCLFPNPTACRRKWHRKRTSKGRALCGSPGHREEGEGPQLDLFLVRVWEVDVCPLHSQRARVRLTWCQVLLPALHIHAPLIFTTSHQVQL